MNFSHKKYNIPLMLCQCAKTPKKKPFSYSKAQAITGNATFRIYLRDKLAKYERGKNDRTTLPDGKKYNFDKTPKSKIYQ
jgi:hypothetical protein